MTYIYVLYYVTYICLSVNYYIASVPMWNLAGTLFGTLKINWVRTPKDCGSQPTTDLNLYHNECYCVTIETASS